MTQLAQVANGFADTAMAGHLGAVPLAAVSAGAALWLPMMIFLLGLLYVLVPVLGHLRGQGDSAAVAQAAAAGLKLAVLGGLLAAGLLALAMPLLGLIGADPALLPEARRYLLWIIPGMPGVALFLALRYVRESAGLTGKVTVVALLGAGLNAGLNYLLMFGALGVEPMGVAGCGLATTLANWTCAIILGLLIAGEGLLSGVGRALTAGRGATAGPGLAALAGKGLPIGLGFVSDYLVVAVVALFIATLGAAQIAGHQIAFNVLSILVMVPLSIAMGGAILLAQALGAEDRAMARAVIRQTLAVNLILALVLAMLAAVLAPLLPGLYAVDPLVHQASQPLLLVVAGLLAFDIAVLTAGSLLRGFGDMTGPFLATALAHWLLSLPLGYALGMTDLLGPARGASGWWTAFGAGLLVAALVLGLRLHRATVRQLGQAGQPIQPSTGETA
ncbi:MATE family efflux transporter [Roseospirillum parvum]|uniref:MATE family efflux transporter n=1 Tax=Roseospirillum parvum TaxID=83401 RepID=UPI001C40B49D|nr:MATE family efflux transporter [Roseospirillum parvum]